ncbi:MAG: MaoC family dehydratase N-terminal domain-containing protein [Dehalococcoidia bacterium]|nr:MAG: MaoC family dehydratase N-terminal domain-containing protein [Dehalococcoidia bacterium]
MSIDSELIKELEGRVGIAEKPLFYEIEKGMIKRFTRAVGDTNPLWQDEKYAGKAGYGGIIAPPNFILILGFGKVLQNLIENPEVTVLHGSTELERHKEIKPGDVISVTNTIRNVRERQGSTGKMLFVTIDMLYENQNQEIVAECRQMTIIY